MFTKGESSQKPSYKPSSKQKKDALWAKSQPTYAWKPSIDYRIHPEQYRVGKGEQGVLICQPYKSEILPHWRFRTPEIAKISAESIVALFNAYLEKDDFVGADMSRKYLQMGYTRARRYANHKGGRKYDPGSGEELPLNGEDHDKVESAQIFYQAWRKAEADLRYAERKKAWKAKYG